MNKKVMSIIAVIALVAILGVCLVACNAESISNKLEKAGYACEKYEAGKDDDGAKIEWKVVAKKKGLNADGVTVTKFSNTDDAKKYESNVLVGSVAGMKMVVKRVGTVCYYGTEQGVKDAM